MNWKKIEEAAWRILLGLSFIFAVLALVAISVYALRLIYCLITGEPFMLKQ